MLVLREGEFSASLEDSSARGTCLAAAAWREREAGRGSSCLVKRLLLVLEKEPCRATEVFSHEERVQPGG